MLVVIGRVRCSEDHRDELVAALTEMQDNSRTEDGCLRYGFFASVEDPLSFVAVEEWADREALDTHFAQPHLHAFARRLLELVSETPEVAIHQVADTQPFPPVTADPELPIAGSAEVLLSAERLWEVFADVRGWPEWNPCMWWARVSGGELRQGATLYWAFNPIRPRYLYKLPAAARIVEFEPRRTVAWEVSMPGFHALHRYQIEPLGPDSCRFGSWEVAEGLMYRRLRPFWLAHFRFVCQASLAGAGELARVANGGAIAI